MKKVSRLFLSVAVCLFIGFGGSLVTTPSISTWYTTLNKPSFNPPNWIFGPVWTTLFILMGIAAFLIWNEGLKKKPVKNALAIFVVQLVLNFFWSLVFFGWHMPVLAFAEIIVLWIMILLTITKFRKLSKTASNLLIPYLAWVSFAAILNLSVAVLNLS